MLHKALPTVFNELTMVCSRMIGWLYFNVAHLLILYIWIILLFRISYLEDMEMRYNMKKAKRNRYFSLRNLIFLIWQNQEQNFFCSIQYVYILAFFIQHHHMRPWSTDNSYLLCCRVEFAQMLDYEKNDGPYTRPVQKAACSNHVGVTICRGSGERK
jgi:hypothetical protein